MKVVFEVEKATSYSKTQIAIVRSYGIKVPKICSTNFSNSIEIYLKPQMTASSKLAVQNAANKYLTLYDGIKEEIKTELGTQSELWTSRHNSPDPVIQFQNEGLYFWYFADPNTKSKITFEDISTPNDATMPYIFFMLRQIEATDARNLEPQYSIKMLKPPMGKDLKKHIGVDHENHTTIKGYTSNDVLNLFEYYDSKLGKKPLKVFIRDKESGVTKVNPHVQNIFDKHAEEFKDIMINVYNHNIEECNHLKTVPPNYQFSTCLSLSGDGPEQTLFLLQCLEIFNSVPYQDFCPNIEYIIIT